MGKRRELLIMVVMILMSVSFDKCFCSPDNDGKSSERLGQNNPEKDKPTPDHDQAAKAASTAPGPIISVVSGESRNVSSKIKNDTSSINSTVEFDPREAVEKGMEYGRSSVKGVWRTRRNTTIPPISRGVSREIRPIGGKVPNNRDDKGKEGVDGTYNRPNRKLQESHEHAEEAKIVYEAAKENLSRATGDLGAAMRESNEL